MFIAFVQPCGYSNSSEKKNPDAAESQPCSIFIPLGLGFLLLPNFAHRKKILLS